MVTHKIQKEIGKLKKGNYIVIDERACVIKKMMKSSPGKHGHAKYRVKAEDMLNGNKKLIMMTGHAKVDVPIIDKKSAQVLSISGDEAQIMDMETYETFNISIPSELKDKIVPQVKIIYWNVLGEKVLREVKS